MTQNLGERPVETTQTSGSLPSRVLPHLRSFTLVPALLLAVVIGQSVSSVFLSTDNLISILQQSSELAIVVIGLSLILIVGRFDLSLESTFGLAPMLGALLVVTSAGGGFGTEVPAVVGVLVAIATGAAIGGINGFFVVYLKLNPFVVTLAMLILLRGVILGLGDGRTITEMPAGFLWLGSASVGGIPVSIIIAGLLFLAAGIFCHHFRLGRSLYAIGGRAEAARAAGVRVNLTICSVYVVAGMLAALAGVMQSGRLGAVTAVQGQNLIFTAFAAAVIGGIALNGGRGTMFGALTGVLLLGVISNVLTLSQIQSFWIDASYGLIILTALIISRFTSGRAQEL